MAGEEVKLPVFTPDMILYIEDPKVSTRKLLGLISSVKLQDTRLIYRNMLFFYTLIMDHQKEKVKKKSHLKLY